MYLLLLHASVDRLAENFYFLKLQNILGLRRRLFVVERNRRTCSWPGPAWPSFDSWTRILLVVHRIDGLHLGLCVAETLPFQVFASVAKVKNGKLWLLKYCVYFFLLKQQNSKQFLLDRHKTASTLCLLLPEPFMNLLHSLKKLLVSGLIGESGIY